MFRRLGYRLEDMSDIKISDNGLEYYIARDEKGYSECCDSSVHWLGCHNPGMWESSQSVESCSTACPVYNLKEGDEQQILQESNQVCPGDEPQPVERCRPEEEENALCAELDRIEQGELYRVKSVTELEKYRVYNVRRLEGDEEISGDEDEPNIVTLDYIGKVHLPGKNFGARYRSRCNASQRGLIYRGEGEYELFKW